MFARDVLCAAVIISLALVLIGCDRETAVNEDNHPQALLQNVVDDFQSDWPDKYWETMEIQAGPHSQLWFHMYQMHAAGWEEDINTVVAVSGASGLYGYEYDTFMPKYAFMHIGANQRIAEATGFGYEWARADSVDAAWELLVESIDTGRPIIGQDAETVLFAGYQDAADIKDRKVFAITIEPGYMAGWWPWETFVEWFEEWASLNGYVLGRHTGRVQPKGPKEVAVRVMAELVTWSVRPPAACDSLSPNPIWGLAGMEAYAADCADIAKYEDFSMCHDMNSQWPTRQCAAVYLKRVAEGELFSAEVNQHLAAAAESYQKAYNAWVVVYKHVGWGAPEGAGKDAHHRQTAAEALREALKHETAALAEIKKALAAEGVDAQAVSASAQGVRFIQAEPVFDIPKLEDGPAGEPTALDERAFGVDFLTRVNARQVSDDFDAHFTLSWTDEALVVGAAVSDDDFVSAESLEKLWDNEGDCILLYVRPADGKMLRVLIESGMTDDQPEPRILHEPHTNRTREATVQRRKLDGGYILQISLPWDLIGIEPAEGQELRVQLIALDVDGSGEAKEVHGLMWYPGIGTREDASLSYRARLAAQASPPFQVSVSHSDFDFYRNQQHTFTVAALADTVGQTARVVAGDQTLAEADMTPDGAGQAIARIVLPLGLDLHDAGELTVTLDGQTVTTFNPVSAAFSYPGRP